MRLLHCDGRDDLGGVLRVGARNIAERYHYLSAAVRRYAIRHAQVELPHTNQTRGEPRIENFGVGESNAGNDHDGFHIGAHGRGGRRAIGRRPVDLALAGGEENDHLPPPDGLEPFTDTVNGIVVLEVESGQLPGAGSAESEQSRRG